MIKIKLQLKQLIIKPITKLGIKKKTRPQPLERKASQIQSNKLQTQTLKRIFQLMIRRKPKSTVPNRTDNINNINNIAIKKKKIQPRNNNTQLKIQPQSINNNILKQNRSTRTSPSQSKQPRNKQHDELLIDKIYQMLY